MLARRVGTIVSYLGLLASLLLASIAVSDPSFWGYAYWTFVVSTLTLGGLRLIEGW